MGHNKNDHTYLLSTGTYFALDMLKKYQSKNEVPFVSRSIIIWN